MHYGNIQPQLISLSYLKNIYSKKTDDFDKYLLLGRLNTQIKIKKRLNSYDYYKKLLYKITCLIP